jgi:monoamine oxidase
MKNTFGSQAAPAVSSDVFVVGGGIAGFTTALTLLDLADAAGLPRPSITILEAGSEPGGRAKTVALANGGTASTGAQWFHGGRDDPFFFWVKNRYPQLSFDFDSRDPEISVNSRGENTAEVFRQLDDLFYQKWAEYHAANPRKDLSLKDFAATIDHPQAREYAAYVARANQGQEDPAIVSSAELLSVDYSCGGPEVKGNMGALIKAMTDELQARGVKVETGAPISGIEQDESGVALGGKDGRVYTSPEAAVTVSAGVLQRGLIEFEPPSSPELKSYLDGISMGRMTKIIVPMKPEFFARNNIQPNTNIDVLAGDSYVFCHARSVGEPCIILYLGGQEAEDMESKPPDAVRSYVGGIFRRIALLRGYPDAIDGDIKVTHWNTDPLTSGSYSTRKPGALRSAPIRDGRIIFAGEAFAVDDGQGRDPGGTMTAAWVSGGLAAENMFVRLKPLLAARLAGPQAFAGAPAPSI